MWAPNQRPLQKYIKTKRTTKLPGTPPNLVIAGGGLHRAPQRSWGSGHSDVRVPRALRDPRGRAGGGRVAAVDLYSCLLSFQALFISA